jgi:RND superfamily putative drug exporter
VSRPESGDTDVATEQLNARAKKGGGVSAQDLLRREGRL